MTKKIYPLIPRDIILILIPKMDGECRSKNLKDNNGIQDLIGKTLEKIQSKMKK